MPNELDIEPLPAAVQQGLESRGHVLRKRAELGVVQAILVKGRTLEGAADPRKEERGRAE
jgi:gamma-glutamyltranspeptidase